MPFALGARSKRLSGFSKALPGLPRTSSPSLPYITHSRPLALLFLEYIVLVLALPVPMSGRFSCRTQQGLLFLILRVSALNLPRFLWQWQTFPPSCLPSPSTLLVGLHTSFLSPPPAPKEASRVRGLCLDHCYAWHRVRNKNACSIILID